MNAPKSLLELLGYEWTEVLTDAKKREIVCEGDDGCEAIYEKRKVLDDLQEKYGLDKLTTYPQIFIKDKHIGGFKQLREYFKPKHLIGKNFMKFHKL